MSDGRYKNIGSPLTKAVEECAEFIHIACKIDRFGWNGSHPDNPSITNKELLKREMNDVTEAFEFLEKYLRDKTHTITCFQCGTILCISKTSEHNNIGRWKENHGWAEDPANSSRHYCPTCARKLGLLK